MTILKGRALRATATAVMLAVFGAPAMAVELFYVSGAVGNAVENFKTLVKPGEEATGGQGSELEKRATIRGWLLVGSGFAQCDSAAFPVSGRAMAAPAVAAPPMVTPRCRPARIWSRAARARQCSSSVST